MKRIFFLSSIFLVSTWINAETLLRPGDREEIFTRPPVYGRFYKILTLDSIIGKAHINAASRVSGSIFYASPWEIMPSATDAIPGAGTAYTEGFQLGDIIQSSTRSLYVCDLVDGVSTWVSLLTSISGQEVFNSTYINNYISSYIDNITTVYIENVYADAVLSSKKTQWFMGDHSLRTIYLDEPAYEGTLTITAITSARISHLVELEKDNHYVEITSPGLLGASDTILAVSPMEKWWKRTRFRFEYYPVRN